MPKAAQSTLPAAVGAVSQCGGHTDLRAVLNERIRVKSLMDGRRFLYDVVKLYANGTG